MAREEEVAPKSASKSEWREAIDTGPENKQGCPTTGKPGCEVKWSSPGDGKGRGRSSAGTRHKGCLRKDHKNEPENQGTTESNHQQHGG